MEIIQTPQQINRDIAAKIADTYDLAWQERVFYEAIRSFKDNDDHTAWPSINTISKMMNCCRNTAKSYISQLVGKGVLLVTSRPITLSNGKSWNDTHTYNFVAEKHDEARKQKVRDSVKQNETGYQRAKREFSEAKKQLSLVLSIHFM